MDRWDHSHSSSKLFTWTIENFSALESRKHYSDVFLLDGYQWQLLIFPKGNNVDQFSIYLHVAYSSILPYGWTRYAQFSLSVVDQVNGQHTVRKETRHQFNASVRDWGFTRFTPLSDLHDPVKGFLVYDTLTVKVVIAKHNEEKTRPIYVGLRKQVVLSTVHFRPLESPNDDVLVLKLSNLLHYDEVVQKVASNLGVHDSSKIRLTRHNWDSNKPALSPVEDNPMDRLEDMLVNSDQTFNIMYYEVFGNLDTEQNIATSCVICFNAPKEGACVPCGHMAACMSCLNRIKDETHGCPVCRAKIEEVIRIFGV